MIYIEHWSDISFNVCDLENLTSWTAPIIYM